MWIVDTRDQTPLTAACHESGSTESTVAYSAIQDS